MLQEKKIVRFQYFIKILFKSCSFRKLVQKQLNLTEKRKLFQSIIFLF